MQTHGLQVVLAGSNAVERVQQTAQTHGAVTSAQFKDVIDKENEEKKSEVQVVEQLAVEVRIRDDLHHPGRQREKKKAPMTKAEETVETVEEKESPVATVAEPSHRLDITI